MELEKAQLCEIARMMSNIFAHSTNKNLSRKLLTGLEIPTSGTIEVMGMKFPKEWGNIQKVLGYCSQDSILFPDLTAMEHLVKFYLIKMMCQ